MKKENDFICSRKQKYVKPEMIVVKLLSENKILITSGDYPQMPWGD